MTASKTAPILLFTLAIINGTWSQKGDENKHFDGLYLGVTVGSQNVIGGSFVDNTDFLQEDTKVVVDIPVGFRKQLFANKLVLGLELRFGFLNGNLSLIDEQQQLQIDYQNDSQFGFGGIMGTTLGKKQKVLVYAYGIETKRKFDVNISFGNNSFTQKDKQGMFKYGLGIEANIYRRLNALLTFGTYRVDFGDVITNKNIKEKLDINIGLVYQL